MAERYLIDTSGVIKYLNGTFPIDALSFLAETLDKESIISFISEIELQVWHPLDPADLQIYPIICFQIYNNRNTRRPYSGNNPENAEIIFLQYRPG